MTEAAYFKNHDRRTRLPWSLYHGELDRRVAEAVRAHGVSPRVLVVGAGLDPRVAGAPPLAEQWACDLDPRAVAASRARHPEMASRIASSPSPYALPDAPGFEGPFDVIVAKEVVEHLDDPGRWARVLASRVAPRGSLVLTTPNYGRFSTLALLERTVLEWIARRDGYSREHIHPSKFDARRLSALDVGPAMVLDEVVTTRLGWALVGRWHRAPT